MKKNRKLLKMLCIVILMIAVQAASAKVWYVGTWTGKAPGDVKTSLAEAWDAASSATSDQIWIQGGTYSITGITLNKNNVSIYGSFAGAETAVDQRTKVPNGEHWEFVNPTILTLSSGEYLFESAANITGTIDGITLDGESTASRRGFQFLTGGGNTNYTISHCIVKNFKTASTVTFPNTDGAGMNIRCKTEIFNCLIENNESPNNGGGIFIENSTTLHDCIIRNNRCTNNGGGIGSFNAGDPKVYNCRIEGNTATNTGGGIYSNKLTVYQCIIVNNTAGKGGGISLDTRSDVTIYNLTVANNRATSAGGAGGVNFYNGTQAEDKTHCVANTILWNNKTSGGSILNVANSNTAKTKGKVEYSIIDHTGYSGLTLSDNVIATDSAALFGENWVTKGSSPGVNKGTITIPTTPPTDFAGAERVVGVGIDIGPYEKQLEGQAIISAPLSEDTNVKGGIDAENSFPAATTLLVQKGGDGANSNGEAFLRIPLSSMNVSPADTVVQVVLKLHLAQAGYNAGTSTSASASMIVEVVPVTSEWNAATLTWNNRGSLTYGGFIATAGGFPSSSGHTPAADNFEVDITNYALQAFKEGKTEISLALRNTNMIGYGFITIHSLESAAENKRPYVNFYIEPKDGIEEGTDEITYNVVEDDYVRSDRQNPVQKKLMVYNNGSLSIDTYLKFDISDFATVDRVTLDLTIGGHSATGLNAQWQVSLVGNNWTEGRITFDNRPSTIGGTIASLGPNIGGITSVEAQWMETSDVNLPISISLPAAYLQQRLNAGNPIITLRISSVAVTGGGEIDFASKETDGTYGNSGRGDLAGQGPKLRIKGTFATNLATLSDLTLDGVTIAGFSPSKTEYSVKLPETATDYPAIVATATDGAAAVSTLVYNPSTFDPDENNTVTFTVTNGGTPVTYTLTFAIDGMESLFDLYMERVRADNMGSRNAATISATVTSALTFWQSDGRFSDINYANTNGSSQDWESLKHVARLRDMAFAYTMPGSTYYESDDLYNKIVTSLTSWVNNHPTACANWWFNQIPEPQYLGLALIQMRIGKNKISSSLATQVCNYMRANGGTPGVPNANSGANRMDVALHWFYRACLTQNETELQKAMTEYYAELQIMNVGSEGLQADGSFFQHGQQFYIGGYGDVFVSGALLLGGYTAGTPYAMSAAQTKILGDFARESYFYTMRGRYHSWGLGGRGYLSRPGATRKGPSYAQRLIPIDPDHTAEYNSIIARINETEPPSYNITPSSKHFYIGDYTTHSRPKYLFDVRMASTRTVRIEYGNYENLRTFFAADGCTNILRTGKEYENIFPVWNWARIPGVTCPQVPNANIPLSASDMNQRGISTFAGGVSDSIYAVTAYSYDGLHTGNSAKKGWFFFDDEVVCLGSDISSVVPLNTYVRSSAYDGIISTNWMTATNQFDINTTVNQCLLKDNVLVSASSSVSTLAAQSEQDYAATLDWVLHDKIGYFFPSGGNVSVSNKTQSGSWYDINRSQSASTLSQNVFSLWFNHGKPAMSAKYAYIVVPEIENQAGMEDYKAAEEIEIIVNSDSVQAVRHKTTGVWGIIFYKKASLESGIAVKADRECAVLLKPASGNTFTMHVADPAHKATSVTVNTRIPATESAWTATTCSGLSSGASKVYTIAINSVTPTYTATISPNGTHAFANATAGYTTQAAQKFVVTNTGTGNLTNVQATIPAGSSHFEISEPLSSTSIALDGGKATVSVRPKNGLAAGDYIGALSITGDNGLNIIVNLSFIVNYEPEKLAWQGNVNNDWNNPLNWSEGRIPTAADTVTISAATHFPVLTQAALVGEIHFEPGAQIGGQHYLMGKAFVQYDLNRRSRWLMLSVPLQQVYPGDFTFGGHPLSWVRTFQATESGGITKGSWVTLRGSTTAFNAGDGFVLWLDPDDDHPTRGLKQLNGVRELPFFHHHHPESLTRQLHEAVHHAHDYNHSQSSSTFYNVTLNESGTEYVRMTNDNYSVLREEPAYRLADETVSKVLNFGENVEAGGKVTLVGNPFMAALNFDQLYTANAGLIKNSYQVWTGIGYQGYTENGSFGVEGSGPLTNQIAPLQSFLVEKQEGATGSALDFNALMTDVSSTITPRASVAETNKLNIIARNTTTSVLAYIAKQEGGRSDYGPMDVRKIINEFDNVPEVYTVKPKGEEFIALGANIINSDNQLIPIGLATSYSGEMTLSFTGMDNYDASLHLIDAAENREIDLTGLSAREYTFTYTPPKENGETVACENRFFIRISKTPTGLAEVSAIDSVNVYSSEGLIRVVSCPTNRIREVLIYDLQGSLLHTTGRLDAIACSIEKKLLMGVYVIKVVAVKNTQNVKLIIR